MTITVGNVQTCLPVRFVASLSLGVVTSSNVATFTQGDLLMRLSSTIRAVLVALTVTGTGLATAAYAASGSIRPTARALTRPRATGLRLAARAVLRLDPPVLVTLFSRSLNDPSRAASNRPAP